MRAERRDKDEFRGCAACKPEGCCEIDGDVLKSSTPRARKNGLWRGKGRVVYVDTREERMGERERSGVCCGCALYRRRTYYDAGTHGDLGGSVSKSCDDYTRSRVYAEFLVYKFTEISTKINAHAFFKLGGTMFLF